MAAWEYEFYLRVLKVSLTSELCNILYMLCDSKTFSLLISLKALSTREFGQLCMNLHKSAKHMKSSSSCLLESFRSE